MSPQDDEFAAELDHHRYEYTHMAEGEFTVYAATESEAEEIRVKLAQSVGFDVRVEPFDHCVYSHTVQVVAPWSPWSED